MKLALADFDGILCIVVTTADYSQPMAISNYYPTSVRTLHFLRCYVDYAESDDRSRWESLLAEFAVRDYLPGEYAIVPPGRAYTTATIYLRLESMAKTLPIHGSSRPIKPPRCRGKIEWIDGRWHKSGAAGRGCGTVDPVL